MERLMERKKIDKTIKEYIYLSSFMLVYASLVSLLFLNWVVPVYGYTGISIKINCQNILLSILFILIIAMFINANSNKIKIMFQNLLVMQSIVPMLCLYSFTEEFSYFNNFILIIFCSIILVSSILLLNIKINYFYSSNKIKSRLNKILLLLTLITLARYIINNGLEVFNLNFAKVYAYRIALRDTMSGYMAYFDSWTLKIFNPTCIALALQYKQKILFGFFFFLQIILYGFSSHKSVLLTLLIVIGFYYFTPYILKNKFNLFKISIFINLIAIFLWKLNITGYFCAIYNRALFTPARINYYYYDYFSKNSFDWFRHSFLRNLIKSPYELLLPRIIGLEYYGDIQTNANTGFLGFGYAQGGFLVVMIYSLLVAMLIMIISSIAKKISPRLVLSISIFPILSLFISGDLPTSLLTGGIIVMILLLYMLSFDKTINLVSFKKQDRLQRKNIYRKIY